MDFNKMKSEVDKNEIIRDLKEKEKRLYSEYYSLYKLPEYTKHFSDFKVKLFDDFQNYFHSLGFEVKKDSNKITAKYKTASIELLNTNHEAITLKIYGKEFDYPLEIVESETTAYKPKFHGAMHENSIYYVGNNSDKVYDIDFLKSELQFLEEGIQEVKKKIEGSNIKIICKVYDKLNIIGEFNNIVDLFNAIPDSSM